MSKFACLFVWVSLFHLVTAQKVWRLCNERLWTKRKQVLFLHLVSVNRERIHDCFSECFAQIFKGLHNSSHHSEHPKFDPNPQKIHSGQYMKLCFARKRKHRCQLPSVSFECYYHRARYFGQLQKRSDTLKLVYRVVVVLRGGAEGLFPFTALKLEYSEKIFHLFCFHQLKIHRSSAMLVNIRDTACDHALSRESLDREGIGANVLLHFRISRVFFFGGGTPYPDVYSVFRVDQKKRALQLLKITWCLKSFH